MATEIRVFEGHDRKWRWHAINLGNHTIVATSGESFASEANAKRAAEAARVAMLSAPVRVVRRPLGTRVRKLGFSSVPARPPAHPNPSASVLAALLDARRRTP
jgi:uncharacterized protein YegP (UPF0339 family)